MSDLTLFILIVDTKIPFHIEACGQYLFLTLCQVLMICFFYPWFTIAFVIIIASVVALDWTMQSGVKETKRLDNQLKVRSKFYKKKIQKQI